MSSASNRSDHERSYSETQSWMGLSALPLSRYNRCRPASRTSTAPTCRSTRRCFETCGWASPSCATSSFTGRSPPARTSRICRRRGSATALNASAVVATRAMDELYIPISVYVKWRDGTSGNVGMEGIRKGTGSGCRRELPVEIPRRGRADVLQGTDPAPRRGGLADLPAEPDQRNVQRRPEALGHQLVQEPVGPFRRSRGGDQPEPPGDAMHVRVYRHGVTPEREG